MNPRLLGRALMIASRVETTFRAGITSGSASTEKTTFYSKQESFLLGYVMQKTVGHTKDNVFYVFRSKLEISNLQ